MPRVRCIHRHGPWRERAPETISSQERCVVYVASVGNDVCVPEPQPRPAWPKGATYDIMLRVVRGC